MQYDIAVSVLGTRSSAQCQIHTLGKSPGNRRPHRDLWESASLALQSRVNAIGIATGGITLRNRRLVQDNSMFLNQLKRDLEDSISIRLPNLELMHGSFKDAALNCKGVGTFLH